MLGVAEVDADDLDPVEAEDDVEERRRRVDDRGDDADQAGEVEPAGEPAPDGAAEPCRPPVDAAGGRVLGDDLRHAEADDQDRDRDQRPAPGDRDRAAVVPRLAVGREAAGEDRDDRERDREVREGAPPAVEVLPEPHLGELALVLVLELVAVASTRISPRSEPTQPRRAIKGVPARPMDDATLNPEPDATSRARARSGTDRPAARAVCLDSSDGEPPPLDGGITNRNYRARFGDAEYVIRVPGKDTGLLGIDREAERLANERAAAVGIAPPVAAMLDDPPCIVTVFVEGRGLSAEDLREPAALGAVARSLRAIHELGEPLPTRVRLVPDRRELRRDRRASAARCSPTPTARRASRRGRSRRRSRAPSTSRCPATTTSWRPTSSAGAERLWIVDWEYAGMGDRYFDLANFAVNNELDDGRRGGAAGRLLRRAAARGRLAALRLMRFMSDFREAMWGVVQERRLRARLRLRRLRRQALRPAARDGRRPALRRLARGGA